MEIATKSYFQSWQLCVKDKSCLNTWRVKEVDTVRCCHNNIQCMTNQQLPRHMKWCAMDPENCKKRIFMGSGHKDIANFTDNNLVLHYKQGDANINSLCIDNQNYVVKKRYLFSNLCYTRFCAPLCFSFTPTIILSHLPSPVRSLFHYWHTWGDNTMLECYYLVKILVVTSKGLCKLKTKDCL
jgi:hypothetical protein